MRRIRDVANDMVYLTSHKGTLSKFPVKSNRIINDFNNRRRAMSPNNKLEAPDVDRSYYHNIIPSQLGISRFNFLVFLFTVKMYFNEL